MKVTLPVITKDEVINGKRELKFAEKEMYLDNSLGCQMRWEINFPELAQKETFVDYTMRLSNCESNSAAVILSRMKAVYCFFDTDLSFIQFIKMFDFSISEYTEKLIIKIDEAFKIFLNSASEKN